MEEKFKYFEEKKKKQEEVRDKYPDATLVEKKSMIDWAEEYGKEISNEIELISKNITETYAVLNLYVLNFYKCNLNDLEITEELKFDKNLIELFSNFTDEMEWGDHFLNQYGNVLTKEASDLLKEFNKEAKKFNNWMDSEINPGHGVEDLTEEERIYIEMTQNVLTLTNLVKLLAGGEKDIKDIIKNIKESDSEELKQTIKRLNLAKYELEDFIEENPGIQKSIEDKNGTTALNQIKNELKIGSEKD